MAKKPVKPQAANTPPARTATPPKAESKPQAKSAKSLSLSLKLCLLLAAIACLVYANTLKNGYVLDDAMVCSKNSLVAQGFKGIPEIFATPRMKGFAYLRNDNYRPLSLAVFAVETELFGPSPAAGHFFNMLFFAGCVVLLFLFLDKLFDKRKTVVAFIAALIFAVHPVHTEVVANIKSLDEILCFFFAFIALNVFLDYMRSGKVWQLVVGIAALFVSFIAKETIITFLGIIPLIFFFYQNQDRKRAIIMTAGAVVVAGAYLALRAHVLNAYDANNTGAIEFIDNPLVTASFNMRIGTAVYILGKYMLLLFIPYPLNCDYCFNSIPLVGFGNVLVLLSAIIYLGLAGLGIYRLFKVPKDPWAFGILFFLATMSLFTNIPFLMGTQMGERFLFFSSVGFCIVVALAIEKWLVNPGHETLEALKSPKVMAVLVPVCLIFSGLTYARNNEWKDNYTLYKSDSQKAPNDCRLYFYLGDELAETVAQAEKDTLKQKEYINEAIVSLRKSIAIYPEYADAHTEAGKAFFLALNYDSAIVHLKRAIELSPYQSIAANNLGTIYLRTGRYQEAIDMYKKAIVIKGDFVQAYFNLGCCYVQLKQLDSAVDAFNKTLTLDPNYTDAYVQMGTAYFFDGQYDKAEPYFKKTLEMNPNDINANNNLGAVYLKKGKFQEAIAMFNKTLQISPTYMNAYSNLAQCYYSLKQYQATIDIINKEVSIDPKMVKDIPYIALCYQAMGNREMALKYEAIARQYYSNFKLQ